MMRVYRPRLSSGPYPLGTGWPRSTSPASGPTPGRSGPAPTAPSPWRPSAGWAPPTATPPGAAPRAEPPPGGTGPLPPAHSPAQRAQDGPPVTATADPRTAPPARSAHPSHDSDDGGPPWT